MKEKLTPYLRKLSDLESIRKQYIIQGNEPEDVVYNDPLMEDSHEVVKGLIHKYRNRALIKVSYLCAAHCRFCTRIRQIGNPAGTLKEEDIQAIIQYLKEHPEIEDVILSGGDPFLSPKITNRLLELISEIDSVKVIRIGTRLPLQAPDSFQSESIRSTLGLIRKIKSHKPFYILLHVEHPDELTAESAEAIKKIQQKTSAVILSQTVFLEGINVDYDILHRLFRELYFLGVIPYYLYHCDKVAGLERFEGDLEKETEIVKKLKRELSGIACPLFIVDIENGYGKLPVDLGMFCTTAHPV